MLTTWPDSSPGSRDSSFGISGSVYRKLCALRVEDNYGNLKFVNVLLKAEIAITGEKDIEFQRRFFK